MRSSSGGPPTQPVVPTARVEELRDGGALFADIRTSLSLAEAKTHTDDLRRALRTSSGPVALVTGQARGAA